MDSVETGNKVKNIIILGGNLEDISLHVGELISEHGYVLLNPIKEQKYHGSRHIAYHVPDGHFILKTYREKQFDPSPMDVFDESFDLTDLLSDPHLNHFVGSEEVTLRTFDLKQLETRGAYEDANNKYLIVVGNTPKITLSGIPKEFNTVSVYVIPQITGMLFNYLGSLTNFDRLSYNVNGNVVSTVIGAERH